MKYLSVATMMIIILLGGILLSACPGTGAAPNRPPIANAGPDQIAVMNDPVILDGSKSFDPDGYPLTYNWRILAVPSGGHAGLNGAQTKVCQFTPDFPGIWIAELTVNDGEYSSAPDVTEIRVQVPPPIGNDLFLYDISANGLADNRTVKEFSAQILNLGYDYTGTLDFRLIGLDKWTNPSLIFDKTATINDVVLKTGAAQWFPLTQGEIDWPENVCMATFIAKVDPQNELSDIDENNNGLDKIFYRDDVAGNCRDETVMTDVLRISGHGGAAQYTNLQEGDEYLFGFEDEPFLFGLDFRNCCPERTIELAIIFDWTPDPKDGENIVLFDRNSLTIEPGKENYWSYSIRGIPREEKYEQNATTLVVIAYHDNGYSILYKTPVKSEYQEIIGK